MTSPQTETKHNVMIVEDQSTIRRMISLFVGAIPGFKTVAEASDIEQALALQAQHRPDVVVLDWMLATGFGLDFLRRLPASGRPRVLVFSANTTDLAVDEALGAGANGFIEKTGSIEEFTAALKAVAAGQTFLSPSIAAAVRRIGSNRTTTPSGLSVREREVLRFVAEGLSSKEIADRLGLSVRTIENHRAAISRATGLRSSAQLALHALRLGLVELPQGGRGMGAGELK